MKCRLWWREPICHRFR